MTKKTIIPRIDDAVDAARVAHPRPEANLPAEVALGVASRMPLIGGLAGAINEARRYLSREAMNDRIEALLDAVNEKIGDLGEQVSENTQRIEDIQERIDSPEFRAAFREASVRTILATEESKPRLYGVVLGASLRVDSWHEASADLVGFVRAIAELGDQDIRILRLLKAVFEDVLRVNPNMHDPNAFTEKAQELLQTARAKGFHIDDFCAHCRRLEGLGLAMEVPRNPSRMAPGDYCFRPSRRGLRLLALLEEEQLPSESH